MPCLCPIWLQGIDIKGVCRDNIKRCTARLIACD